MTADDLLAEGHDLARRCVYLRPAGNQFAAWWTPRGASGFTLEVGSEVLPDGVWNGPGVLQVHLTGANATASFAGGRTVQPMEEGLALHAHVAVSLPPAEALFMFGSPRVQEWLRSMEWPPEAGLNDNFPARETVSLYEREFQAQLPLYSGSAHAVLGGWHFPWPDGDWQELLDAQLVLWTFAGAEPWVEVWLKDGRLSVMERVT